MTAHAPIFIDTATVASRLGFSSPQAFLMRRHNLEDNHGLPMPLTWCQRPLKWRADQIEHWITLQGIAPQDDPPIDPGLISSGKVRLLAEARRA